MKDYCNSVRPLLFAMLEGQIDAGERVRVNAHLAVCADCRSFERSERALTDLLAPRSPMSVRAPRPTALRLAATFGVAAAAALLIFLLPAATPQGSVIERHMGPTMEWELNAETEVKTSNHFSVPRTNSVEIKLTKGLRLSANGPTSFELDFVDGRWKVVVLEGLVRATTEQDGSLVVAYRSGSAVLGRGSHELTAHAARLQDPKKPGRTESAGKKDAARCIAEGLELFSAVSTFAAVLQVNQEEEQANMAAAEKLFLRALQDPDITDAQRNTALFYLGASQGRQHRPADALATGQRWLEAFPNASDRDHVLFYQAAYHEDLGNLDDARRIREQIIAEFPGSTWAGHAKAYMDTVHLRVGNKGGKRSQPSPGPAETGPKKTVLRATSAKPGPYLVVRVDLDEGRPGDAGYLGAAKAAVEFHDAQTESWDGRDTAALARMFAQHRPENVLFVLRPETLDINLHRNILLGAIGIDDDIFVDCAFGYLTARDGAGAVALWQRIVRLHQNGLGSKTWDRGAVTSSPQSLDYASGVPGIAQAAGFTGQHFYVSIHDPNKMEFVDRKLAELEDAAVIQFTGNGDPQGIWLFDDHRNIDRSKHWPYDAEMVGHDPEGEMPRITAERFRALKLTSPIVWSGTCHSAATCKVYVEGDIVSTFGRTEVATVHRLDPKKSLALALLDAGAAALLAPIAANHGMSVMMETDFALRWGASLGEIVKSTYDDVALAADGELVLDFAVEGQKQTNHEYVMQGGGANRILIGDPALRPFEQVTSRMERVDVERTADGLRVTVDRADGFAPRAWDMFGKSQPNDWRIITRIDVTDLLPSGDVGIDAKVTATDSGAKAMPYRLRRCWAEEYHGRRYLHLQANGHRETVERKAVTAVFDVKVR